MMGIMMDDEEELYRKFGLTSEQVEQWVEDAENDNWGDPSLWGPVIKVREPTPEEREAIDRSVVLRDRIDALKAATGMSELEAEIKMEAIVKAEEVAAEKSKIEAKGSAVVR
ncbi:hypothetical protein [Bifidobacterium sp. ESL0745]|uniref:hypothetical protein n=1 Tax=Bifidobacterium sp. ESL0745 TaxID=2983226 RepID=UPI0023F9FD2B|nr:hypothetical protein [Bifidobacterium sp. ESL0745]MDF7666213.1 hypothetical protein [Bifidobacterium sp. ESL0745]